MNMFFIIMAVIPFIPGLFITMTLRKKTLIIIYTISLLLITLIVVASRFILLESLYLLEDDYCKKNVQRAFNVMTNENNNLLSTAGDYAAWDDTYEFMADMNNNYMNSNIIPETLAGLNLNLFLFIDKQDHLYNSFAIDLKTKRRIDLSPELKNLLEDKTFMAKIKQPDGFVGFIQLNEGSLLFASHPVLTSKHLGPDHGLLMVGRFIGDDYAEHLSKSTQSSIQIEPYSESSLSREFKTAAFLPNSRPETYIKEIDSQTIAGYTLIKDVSDQPVLILRTSMDRDIYRQGYSTILFFIVVVFLGCIFFVFAIYMLLDRQVISRIATLGHSVGNINLDAQPFNRVPVSGSDEISSLSQEINNMLDSLEEYDTRLRQSRDDLEKRIKERTAELQELNFNLTHEIRERELSEKALIETYNEINQILGSISSMIIGVTSDHSISEWNDVATNLLGLSANEVIGRNFFELPIKWDWDRLKHDTEECSNRNMKIRMEDIILEKSDDDHRILGITLTPLNAEDEHPGFLLVGADITERRHLEQKLGQSNKMEAIGQMAAGIAHEINTPTQLVGSNLRFLGNQLQGILELIDKVKVINQYIKSNSASPEMGYSLEKAASEAHLEYFRQEAPKAIADSLEGIDRITHIVSAMRYFSHPGTDEKELANLNQIIQNALSLSRNEWKNVAEIKTNLQTDLPLIECLPSDLSQVILNLIINAVYAIKEVYDASLDKKGVIEITTRQVDHNIEVRVADNGSGIPEKIRSKIFDPFFTTKDVGIGTGQGLAICYSVIVKKHGGTIEFETEVGRGTTFIISLPWK